MKGKLRCPFPSYFSYTRDVCNLQSIMFFFGESVCGNACIYVSCWVLCLFAWGILLDTFLVLSEHIVCEWFPVIVSPEPCLLPNHTTAVAFPLFSLLTLVSPLSLLLSSLFTFFASLYLARKVIWRSWGGRGGSSMNLFHFFFLSWRHSTTKQPMSFCQVWLQLPSVGCVTTKSRGCFDDRSPGRLCWRGPYTQ